jgi:iron(III) transport system permease protein
VARSVPYAAAAATLCTFLGGAIASARDRGRSWVARAVGLAAELPYAVPGTAIAVGLLLAFSREIRLVILDEITVSLALAGTGALLVVAYAVKGLAIGIRNAAAGLARLDPALVEAARISGSGPWGAEARITFPLLAPVRRAAFTLVLLPAFGEITMSILLFSPDTETLGVTLFDLQSYADPPAAAVLATLLLGATVVVTLALGLLSRGRSAARGS